MNHPNTKLVYFFFILLFAFSCHKNPLGYDELERDISAPVGIDFSPEKSYCYGKYIPLGNSDILVLGKNSEYESRILIQFPLTDSLLSQVTSVKLYLYPQKHKNINFTIHPLMKLIGGAVWKENYATWKIADENNTPWSGGYFYVSQLASGNLTADSCVIELNRNLLDTLVNQSLGLIILPDQTTQDFATISSRSGSKSPKLVLYYGTTPVSFAPSQDCHIIDTLNLNLSISDRWFGSGFPFRTILKFSLNTIPYNATITNAELVLGIDQKFALSDTLAVGVWRVIDSVKLSGLTETKFASSYSAKRNFSITNDSIIKIDLRSLVQYWIAKPDSNFGALVSIYPENFEISRIQLKTFNPYGPQLKIGYILPPQGRF